MWRICCEIFTFNHEMRATDLQQRNIQKTKTILLQCKNHTFEKQQPHYSKVIAKRNINNSQYLEK